MLHEPAAESGPDYATKYKMRLGVVLFTVYSIIYFVFVGINVIDAALMDTIVVFGLNLAVVYGFSLIIIALIFALVYNAMCTKRERLKKSEEAESKEKK